MTPIQSRIKLTEQQEEEMDKLKIKVQKAKHQLKRIIYWEKDKFCGKTYSNG